MLKTWMPEIRWLLQETLALVALAAFLATVASWCAIFIWGI